MLFFRAMFTVPCFEEPFLSYLYAIGTICLSSHLSCFQSLTVDGLCLPLSPACVTEDFSILDFTPPFPPLLCFQHSLSFPFLTLPQHLQCGGVGWKVAVKAPFAAVLPLGVLVEIPWISTEVSSSPSFLASEELGSFSPNNSKKLELVAVQARVISSQIVLGIICHLWLIVSYISEETFPCSFWPYEQPIFFLFKQNGNVFINILDVSWKQ